MELYERPINGLWSVLRFEDSDDLFYGWCIRVEDPADELNGYQQYILLDETSVDDRDNPVPESFWGVWDTMTGERMGYGVSKMVYEAMVLEQAIELIRIRRAKELAGSDPILYEIFLRTMAYENGDVSDPIHVAGITFWRVGRNASHEFYMGRDKNGQRYRYSVGEGDRRSKPEKVKDFNSGYYGHF